jgi:uncharacterized NAD(P)/FAD-binding protein YdhS
MPKIAIVGGGCSGVLMILSLLRHYPSRCEITIFDSSEHLGHGVAYATQEAHHLLNVPAGRMGLWSDDHGDFFEWIQSEGLPAEASDFVPRMWFAKYLLARLEDEKRKSSCLSSVAHARVSILGVSREEARGWRLIDSSGAEHTADVVILALGLPNVSWPRAVAGIESTKASLPQSLHVDSWSDQALKSVTPSSKVLLLGSGLTTVDTILSLRAKGVEAPITVLSRHGRFPISHFPDAPPSTAVLQSPLPKTLHEATKKFRELLLQHRWDAAIDAFRPHISAIWSGFTPKEQDRFRRHIQPLWDIHRHRMAPKIWARINAQLNSGKLIVQAGRLRKVEPLGPRIVATIQPRSGDALQISEFDSVINCTGFGTLDSKSYGGLLTQLVEQKTVTLDRTRTGVVTNGGNSLRIAEDMYAFGALLRAERWESIAVPELRQQASEIVRSLSSAI